MNLKLKINEETEEKQAPRHREHFDSCQKKGVGEISEKMQGLRSKKSWGCKVQHRK